MLPSVHEDPATVNDSSAKAKLGNLYIYAGGGTAPAGIYRYMRAEDADWADGDVLNPADTTLTEATNDRSGGSAIAATITCGVAVATVTDGNCGYVLVQGVHTAVKTDDGISAGEYMVAHTVDGEADTMNDGEEEQVFGYSLDGDGSSSTCAAVIRCL